MKGTLRITRPSPYAIIATMITVTGDTLGEIFKVGVGNPVGASDPFGSGDATESPSGPCAEADRLIAEGTSDYENGKFEEAVECYTSALKICENKLDALYILGIIFNKLARYDEARGIFTRLAALADQYSDRLGPTALATAHHCLGGALLAMWGTSGPKGHAQDLAAEAEQEFRKAITLDPDAFVAWFGLGVSLHILEQLDEAEAAFRRALDVDPGSKAANDRLRAVLEDRVERRLFELGYLRQLRKPIYDFTPYENRSLIEVQGKPISEIVVEDRG